MAGYLEAGAESAGSLTHKEAGFVQEILTLEGLSRGERWRSHRASHPTQKK